MNQPQLIFTGGTLCSYRDFRGLLMPTHGALDGMAKKLGFDTSRSVKPYFIDSIDFDIGRHYPKLLNAATAALDAGNTPIVCGGTDSLAWYSTLLTKDLMRRGYLRPHSEQKVIFLTSMKSLDDAAGLALAEKILEAGKVLAAQSWSGGYAINPLHIEGEEMVVHDALNHFDKISSTLVNALRSKAPEGYILKGTFHRGINYEKPPVPSLAKEHHYARIAPPLLGNHDSEAVLAYMKLIGQSEKPFDGILIEDLPTSYPRLHRHDEHRLVETVKWLRSQGMRVVFCDPLHYHADTCSIRPVKPANGNSGALREELLREGAEFVDNALTKDAYLDMVLATPPPDIHPHKPPPAFEVRPQGVLGIRYVPDATIMNDAIDALAPKA